MLGPAHCPDCEILIGIEGAEEERDVRTRERNVVGEEPIYRPRWRQRTVHGSFQERRPEATETHGI